MHSRNGNVVLEPLSEHSTTPEQAKWLMKKLYEVVAQAKLDTQTSITVRCWRNEIMTRQFASELIDLILDVAGVPRIIIVDPTMDAAAYFFDAAQVRGKQDAVTFRLSDGVRTSNREFDTLEAYLNVTCRN